MKYIILYSLLISPSLYAAKKCSDYLLKHRDEMVHKDPHRWLENDTPEREQWFKLQHKKVKNYFKTKMNGTTYWEQIFLNEYSQPHGLMQYDLSDGQAVMLMDMGLNAPNVVAKLNADNTLTPIVNSFQFGEYQGQASITKIWVNPKKDFLIVPVAYSGSIDVIELHVYNLVTGEKLEVIKNAGDYNIQWGGDNIFIYQKYVGNELIQLIHPLGTKKNDIFYEASEWQLTSNKNNHSNNLVHTNKAGKTKLTNVVSGKVIDLDFPVKQVAYADDKQMVVVKQNADEEDEIVKIMESGVIRNYDPEKGVLKDVFELVNYSVHSYSMGARYWANVYDANQNLVTKIELPNYATLNHVEELENDEFSMVFQSMVVEYQNVTYDIKSKKFLEKNMEDLLLTDATGVRYVNEFFSAKSADGAKVPVRVVYRKGLKLDGNNPSFLEGYGGFGAAGYFDASYSTQHNFFLRDGGVYVAPALRGGNELGEKWAAQAQFDQKQNTFNDLIATIETLHRKGYSRPRRTAIAGWSNGGLLIGALVTQRPDLIRLALPGNGVQDMLRKELLDPRFDNGWSYEYGNTSDPYMFQYMQGYSPVALAERPQHYPTTLVIAAKDDSRVKTAHSYKLTQALQQNQKADQTQPILMLHVPDAGHWATYEDLQDIRAYTTLTKIWTALYYELSVKPSSESLELLEAEGL
ncbi:MAG: S9 family peptidase [Bacteriovoracaceae bacterium]|nr:S9 family peptidase [Bacteriovoracaceae bacterium]